MHSDFFVLSNVKQKKNVGNNFTSAEVAFETLEKHVFYIPTSEWKKYFVNKNAL